MNWLKNKYAAIKNWVRTPRGKRIAFIAIALMMAGWVVFRFSVIAMQNRMQVFNTARAAAADGVPVMVLEMRRTDGVVREPLTVRDNRAYISGARMRHLAPGMRVGDGEIVSISANLDLDSGMYIVRTRGVSDGLQFALFRANGYFVPAYAVSDNTVLVVRDGIATPQTVTVSRTDADTAYITSGLVDGDKVILSRVPGGTYVRPHTTDAE